MSDLDNAIQSINTAAERTTKTAEFVDQLSTYDDASNVTNPNTGTTVPSIQKKTRLVAEAAFAESETQINQAVSDAELAALAAQSSANYDTEFVAGLTSAIKGKSYLYNGSMWACLNDTTETPSLGNANWYSLANHDSLTNRDDTNAHPASSISMSNGNSVEDEVKDLESRLLGVGVEIYRGSNGRYVQNGDTVPSGTTHLTILINGVPEDVAFWDTPTLPATLISDPVANDYSGYDVVTDQGTFEVIGSFTKFLRDVGDVKGWGAELDNVKIDTDCINRAIQGRYGKDLYFPDGTALIDGQLDFSSWSGRVFGSGKIRCMPSVSIPIVINMTSAVAMVWDGVEISMGQSETTLDSDNRADSCFYYYNARSCRLLNATVTNVRVGEPIYINGSSSNSPSSTDGSKRIFVDNFQCVAYEYDTVDIGASVYIRSDFYTGDGGGMYYPASNALKVIDLEIDDSIAYARTTSDIFFSNCTFTNFDRIGYFNVKSVHMTNVVLNNFFTRGHTLSPTCEDVRVNGGVISGNAAQINVNYGCKNCSFDGLTARGEFLSIGQRHAIRAGFGSKNISFTNISGFGNDVSQIYIEGASSITFDNIILEDWDGGTTTTGVTITNPSGATDYIIKKIKLNNLIISSNYGLEISEGDGAIEQRAINISACDFTRTLQLFSTLPNGGQIEMTDVVASEIRNDSLDSSAFSCVRGGNIGVRMSDDYNCLGTSADQYPTFSKIKFPTTFSNQGDAARLIPLRVYYKKSGESLFHPLVYGTDWFIDTTIQNLGMSDRIRLANWNSTGLFEAGDIIHIERIE